MHAIIAAFGSKEFHALNPQERAEFIEALMVAGFKMVAVEKGQGPLREKIAHWLERMDDVDLKLNEFSNNQTKH